VQKNKTIMRFYFILALLAMSGTLLLGQSVNLIKDINPGVADGNPAEILSYNGQLIFQADSEDTGVELWISDGTEAGTRLLKDINTDEDFFNGNSNPDQFIQFEGRVFFAAQTAAEGRELWVSNGTEAGTQLFKDIHDGEGSSNPQDFVVFQDQLWFTATTEGEGAELWVSDGTAAGTELFLDINADSLSGNPDFKYVINEGGLMFFNARTEDEGVELWISDGSLIGTQLLKDINEGEASSTPSQFVSVGGTVFFRATTDSLGTELWRTDGTESRTRLAVDFNEGAGSSNPDDLIQIGIPGVAPPVLFCSADPDGQGNRIFVVDPSSDLFNDWTSLSEGEYTDVNNINRRFDFTFSFTAFLTRENDSGGIDTIGEEVFLADPLRLVFPDKLIERLSNTPNNLDPDPSDFNYELLEGYLYYTKQMSQGRELFRVPYFGNFESEEQLTFLSSDVHDAAVSDLAILGKDVFFQGDDGNTGQELYAFFAEKGEFEVSRLPSRVLVNEGDTLDIGIVELPFDTSLQFEILNIAEPIIGFSAVEVEGNRFAADSINPTLLFFQPAPGAPVSDRDTFVLNYTAMDEGNIDVGTVTVRTSFTDNENFTFYIKAEVETTVSAEDDFARNWELSPNPVSTTALLSGQALESDGQVHIIDNQGRLIKSFPIRKYQTKRKLILGELQAGHYYLRIYTPNKKGTTIPLIKQ
jgi:ELWxxDGT repeat protein